MTNKLDKMRAKQQAAYGTTAPPPETPKLVATENPATLPKAAPNPAGDCVTYACGHKVGLKNFADRKCPGCTQAARKTRNRERQERTAGKKERRDDQRLPDGAEFRGVVYHAKTMTWQGELWLPNFADAHGMGCVGSATASGVMKLLRVLDGMYREWLKESP